MTNFSPPGLCEHGRAIRSTEETLSYAGAIDQCACCDHLYGNFDPHMPRGDDRVRYCHSCRGRDAFTKGPPGTLADGFNEIIGVRDHDRTAVPLVPGLQASK